MFNKDKNRTDGLFPHCKICVSTYKKNHRESHKDELKEKKRKWRTENKEKVRHYFAKYRAKNREAIRSSQAKYQSKNKEQCARRAAKWRQENHVKQLCYRWERIAKQKQRSPQWANNVQIKLVYEFSKKLGNEYEVDHIYPIGGKLVSGLHVPENLLVVHRTKNRSKGNKMPDGNIVPTINSVSFKDFLQIKGIQK